MQSQAPHETRIADGCSLHEGQPFIAICRQCGSYMCKQCNDDGKFIICQSCRAAAKQAPPPGTSHAAPRHVSLTALLAHSFAVYKRNFLLVSLLMACSLGTLLLLQIVVGALLSLMPSTLGVDVSMYWISSLLDVALAALLSVGMLRIGVRLVRGEPAELAMLWQGLDRLGALLLQWLVLHIGFSFAALLAALPFMLGMFGLFAFAADSEASMPLMVAAGIGSLLVLLTMVYVGLGVWLAPIELVAQARLGAFVSLGNAWRLASGQRITLFLASLVMLALVFAGVLFCLVGLVFTLGLGLLFYCSVYLALREGAPELAR